MVYNRAGPSVASGVKTPSNISDLVLKHSHFHKASQCIGPIFLRMAPLLEVRVSAGKGNSVYEGSQLRWVTYA